ncbi:MAG: PEP-CTERM sorting domain-containing protein [Rhodoferax sp.]
MEKKTTTGKSTWWQRSALVLVAAVSLCGTAMAQTVGTISGTGSYTPAAGAVAESWSFSGGFSFASGLQSAMGDVGQFQFQANSGGVSVVDGNGVGGATHNMGFAPWQIINTNATNPNSTLYGPSATFNVLGGAVSGTLSTDGNIHWYYGFDGDAIAPVSGKPGMTPLSAFGTASVLTFTGTPTITSQSGSTQNFTFNATVAAVPEPETYAMLLAGLGLLGAVARRKKNRQADAG